MSKTELVNGKSPVAITHWDWFSGESSQHANNQAASSFSGEDWR